MRSSTVHALAVFAIWAFAPAADANVGPPTYGGQIAGEAAAIPQVAIAHEDLRIDLRPLADGRRAVVTATYQLDSRGEEKQLDLVFAAGAADLKDIQVTFDGRPVPNRMDRDLGIPAAWRAPATTPRPAGDGVLTYDVQLRGDRRPLGFHLAVPAGRHELAVAYTADSVTHHIGEPTVARQFAYVLAPARAWDGFGGLDVTIHVPADWRAAVTPAMSRVGDTFRSTFPDVPADAIGIATQAPARAYPFVRFSALAALAVVTRAGPFAVRRRAATVRKRRVLAAVALGGAWSLSFFAIGCAAIVGPYLAIPQFQADRHGYGDVVADLALLLAAVVVFAIGVLLSFRASHPR